MNSDAAEGSVVPAPLVTLVVLLLLIPMKSHERGRHDRSLITTNSLNEHIRGHDTVCKFYGPRTYFSGLEGYETPLRFIPE